MLYVLLILSAALLAVPAVGQQFVLNSTAFSSGGTIPEKYTCDGADVSPALAWKNAPKGTKTLALLCEDPDAPAGTFTHWTFCGLSSVVNQLPEGFSKSKGNATEGKNDFGKTGYNGPCPPSGSSHRYFFRLYALDMADLKLSEGFGKLQLMKAIKGHILGQTELMGAYKRK